MRYDFRNCFSRLAHKTHCGVDGDRGAFLNDGLQQRSLEEALDLKQGLVRLDLEEDVTFCDGLAHLLPPTNKCAHFLRLPQLGHGDRSNHGRDPFV